MEIVSALLGFGSNLLNVFSRTDQTRAKERIERGQQEVDRRAIEAQERIALEQIWGRERAEQIQAWLGKTQIREQSQIERTRAFYGFATARELRGTYVAIAGVGLVALALFFSRKERT